MELTKGVKTSEFWLTAVGNLFAAIFMILLMYKVVTTEEAQIWKEAIALVTAFVVPTVSAMTTREYTRGRTTIKLESMLPAASRVRPQASE